jgi:hypothetical protein
MICTRVKEEVIVADSSNFTYHSIDLKLKKLQEHISSLKNSENLNTNEIQKDMHYILLLLQYISDAVSVCKIDNKSITDLKRILTNIDVINFKFLYPQIRLLLCNIKVQCLP